MLPKVGTAMVIWVILPVAFVVFVVALLGYRRMTVPRRVSPEGIEDDEVVQAYDRISRWPQFRFLRGRILAELRRHHPEGVLADVGCGPGYLIVNVARSFPHLSIIGVDISAEMLQKAIKNLSLLGLAKKGSFRQGDIHKLPFGDNYLDFVVSTLSLHHWSQPKEAMGEMYRVLKPGGQLLIFDLRRDSRRLFYWLIRFAQTFIAPSAIKRINEPTGSFLASYTPAELETLLSTTSFVEWWIQPRLGWVFVWARKGKTE